MRFFLFALIALQTSAFAYDAKEVICIASDFGIEQVIDCIDFQKYRTSRICREVCEDNVDEPECELLCEE